ncbi:MAG: replicative DNA helicase [Clostridiales bacterium]|nr:replicative DNA helicase [Clostridiales bacterium]
MESYPQDNYLPSEPTPAPQTPSPHSHAAEQSVLGAALSSREALEEAAESLRAEDFYVGAHREIFTAMLQIHQAGHAVDMVTLREELARYGKLDIAGGDAYLAELYLAVPTAENVRHYIRIVEERALQRGIIRAGSEMMRDGYSDEKDVEDSLNEAERRIYALSMRKSEESLLPASDVVFPTLERIGNLMANKGKLTGVDTGFTDLNRSTNGLQPSDLIILAARPAMGKTTLALNIAHHAAVHDKRSVAFFCLEMSREQLMQRMLCAAAAINSERVKNGTISQQELASLLEAAAPIENAKLFIDDSGGATVASIRSKCRRLKVRHGLDLVVIDYMQLMSGTGQSGRKNDNRQQEISDMTRMMKLLARELNVPILLLSQLNRDVEKRAEKRPQVSDLRESGSIEQDADMVLLLYREQVYNPAANDEAELIIGKYRHGEIGKVMLVFKGEYTRFVNWKKE